MAKYTVRISGNAPVWADVVIEADSPLEALENVGNEDAENADWELCEGGNGVDDWSTTGEIFDEDGDEINMDEEDEEEEETTPVVTGPVVTGPVNYPVGVGGNECCCFSCGCDRDDVEMLAEPGITDPFCCEVII